MDHYTEFSPLRVALQKRHKLQAEIAALRLARIDLHERYNQGGRWAGIYARRLDENGWDGDRAQKALDAVGNKIRTLTYNTH